MKPFQLTTLGGRAHARRATAVSLLCATTALCTTITATAQDSFPNRTIEMIVPYTPGGSSDQVGRIIAQALSDRLKTPSVVMNRPGASGMIGLKSVAAAPSDGYTLGVGGTTNLAIAPYLAPEQPYDPVRDFTPIAVAANVPFVLVAGPHAGFKTVDGLITAAKNNPGKLNYGSSGIGGSHHMMTELFSRTAGITATHIPFKGGAENVNQLMSGTVDFMFEATSSILQLIKAGRVHALAVTSNERHPDMPNVPTMKEAGIDNFVVVPIVGIVAPANLPANVKTTLSKTITEALADPAIRQSIDATGLQAPTMGGDDFSNTLKADAERWRKLISDLGLSSK